MISLLDLSKVNWKPSGKDSRSVRIFKIHGEVKISKLIEVWKKLTPTLIEDLEAFRSSVEKVTVEVVETARQLEVEPEDGTELLQSHDKTWSDELFLMDEQRKWFLETESTPGEDAVKRIEMTVKT